MKHCSVCGQDKPYDQFYKSGKYLTYDCKQCRSQSRKAATAARNAHVVPMSQRTNLTCRDCSVSKPKSEFYRRNVPSGNEVYVSRCKDCSSAYHRNKRSGMSKDEKTSDYVRLRYGLSLESYFELLSQGCYLCGSDQKLRIDHDHSCCPSYRNCCGKCIRGVLCDRHNMAEGNFTDEELIKLVKYRGLSI